MTIRPATKEDIPALAEFIRAFADYHRELDSSHKAGAEYGALDETIEEWLSDRAMRIFVAEDRGEAIGYLRVSVEPAPSYSREKKIGKINDVYVAPAARKSGVLRGLFEASREWFLTKKVKNVELNVLVKNADAIAAWRALGFQEYKLRMRRGL